MYIKIENGDTTVCYTASQYALVHRSGPISDKDFVADLALYQDGRVIVDYPLPTFSSVYIMNEDGKTIDTYRMYQ